MRQAMPSTCLWYNMNIMNCSSYENKWIKTHKHFIYRGNVSANKTLIIILTSLSYVITMINVVRIRVNRKVMGSQISYTRRVHIDTWMYCSMNIPRTRTEASNGPMTAAISKIWIRITGNMRRFTLNSG